LKKAQGISINVIIVAAIALVVLVVLLVVFTGRFSVWNIDCEKNVNAKECICDEEADYEYRECDYQDVSFVNMADYWIGRKECLNEDIVYIWTEEYKKYINSEDMEKLYATGTMRGSLFYCRAWICKPKIKKECISSHWPARPSDLSCIQIYEYIKFGNICIKGNPCEEVEYPLISKNELIQEYFGRCI